LFLTSSRPFTTHPDFVTFHVNTPVSGVVIQQNYSLSTWQLVLSSYLHLNLFQAQRYASASGSAA
jgi:hypothetical protein